MSNRWMRSRWWSSLVAISAVCGLGSCVEGSPMTGNENGSAPFVDAAVGPPPSNSESSARQRMDQLRSRVGEEGVVIGPIETSGGWFAFSASRQSGPVDLWRFNGQGWDGANQLMRSSVLNVESAQLLDIDGDRTSEVLFEVVLNGSSGSLLRFEFGSWSEIAWEENLRYDDRDGLTYTWNDCDPSCAEGLTRTFRMFWEDGGLVSVASDDFD